MQLSVRSALLMVAATVMWGGHFVLAGVATAEISPFSLTFLRWAAAALPLLLIAQVVERPDWRRVLRAWPRLLLVSSLGMLAYNLLLYSALDTTTPIGASLVNAANPAVMALLAAVVAREMLRPRGVAGILVSLVGVLIVVSGGSLAALLDMDVSAGQLLMVGAIVVWSLYSIWGRIPDVPPITSTALQASIAVAVMLPFTPVVGVQLPTSADGWWALVYIALAPSIGSFVLWNIALRSTPPAIAGNFLNLITVSAVAIGALAGALVTGSDLIGGVVIIAGVLLTSLPAAKRRREALRTPGSRRAVPMAPGGTPAAKTRSVRRARRPRPRRVPGPR